MFVISSSKTTHGCVTRARKPRHITAQATPRRRGCSVRGGQRSAMRGASCSTFTGSSRVFSFPSRCPHANGVGSTSCSRTQAATSAPSRSTRSSTSPAPGQRPLRSTTIVSRSASMSRRGGAGVRSAAGASRVAGSPGHALRCSQAWVVGTGSARSEISSPTSSPANEDGSRRSGSLTWRSSRFWQAMTQRAASQVFGAARHHFADWTSPPRRACPRPRSSGDCTDLGYAVGLC